ncbi:MAG: exonuclease domain-containing protein [Pseudomonadota bacterium]
MADGFDQSETVARGRARVALPERYYLEHFCEMLTFVEQHYGAVLGPDAAAFVAAFPTLSLDERCLYTRLVGRRGRVFRRSSLAYSEIDDIDTATDGLLQRRWLCAPESEHLDAVLALMKRGEILAWLRAHVPGVARSLKKADYAAMVREHCDRAAFVAAVGGADMLVRRHTEVVRYLAFLYFGENRAGLAAFTMRDLGLIRARRPSADYEPRFADVDEAQSCFFYATAVADLSQAPQSAGHMADPTQWPAPIGTAALKLRDRLALAIGRNAERAENPTLAVAAYRVGATGDCLQSAVRLLIASGDRHEARALIDAALDAPRSDDERVVAEDLLARKFGAKRTSARTDCLRDSEIIDADQSLLGSPEEAVAAHFKRQGLQAVRVENRLWRALFGLIFWDELNGAATHSPFDAMPAPLADGSFGRRYAETVAVKLGLCDDPSALVRALTKTAVANYGKSNGVFRWRSDTLELLVDLVRAAPSGAIRHVIAALAEDFVGRRHGWPDLLLIDGDRVEFVEVKAEGDQLRRSQWQRLELLKAAGFEARIVRVRWTVDPAQCFVVVDVETTGGRGEHHRVTELGAVRVRDGQIVARYQTLLHPQRAIPPAISRLTGITETMVAQAPTFAEIADDFERFLADAIFVAHNVAFDYRFVRQEFARLGRSFRAPKLCTCAGMRRFFPGQRSYSLRALCDAFQIPLRQHHRALCDAEAATELLFLINDKRAELVAAGEAV